MGNLRLDDIQPGWKVFAGSDQVGTVSQASPDELFVQRGTLFRHTYRVPEQVVGTAEDGVVDLVIDRDAFEDLEVQG